jgi:hypothetical protein
MQNDSPDSAEPLARALARAAGWLTAFPGCAV